MLQKKNLMSLLNCDKMKNNQIVKLKYLYKGKQGKTEVNVIGRILAFDKTQVQFLQNGVVSVINRKDIVEILDSIANESLSLVMS